MKKSFLILLFALPTAIIKLSAQSKEPTAEHKKLLGLEGRWTIKGMEDKYLEICEMYQGGYFLVCNTEFKNTSGGLSKGVSIIGYSTENKHVTYYHYGSSGVSQTLKGTADEAGNFFFEGEEIINGKLTKTRVAMRKAGKNFTFKEEISVENGPWNTSAEIDYIKLP